MHRKIFSVPAMFQLLSVIVLCGCAAVGTGPIVLQPLPADPGPLCVDSRTDPIGPAACTRRLYAFIQRNVAVTVTIGQLAYDETEGSSGRSGTGTVIGPDGLILTAYHVVKDAEYIMATIRRANLAGGVQVLPVKTVPLVIAAYDAGRDIALLKPRHPTEFPLYLAVAGDRQPRPGEFLWHFGQASVGLRGTVQNWPVTEPQLGQDGLATLKVACRSGDSGGPVVSLDGRLVGVILASVEGEDLTYFLPIAEVMPLLEKIEAVAPVETVPDPTAAQ